jgi:integral membrane sensor domain MASE1
MYPNYDLGREYLVPRVFKTLQNAPLPSLLPDKVKIIIIVAISYFATGILGVRLAVSHAGASAVWLPAGISLAVFLIQGNSVWPGVFLGALCVNLAVGVRISPALDLAMVATLSAALGSYLINRFAQGTRSFFKSGDALRFVLLAGLVTALGACFAVFLRCAYGYANWAEFGRLWSLWWVGDMLGTLILAPFIVLMFGHSHHSLRLAELSELTVLLAGLSIVCVLNFGPPIFAWIPRSGLHYLCVPFLAWAAFRFCPLEAAGASIVVGGFAMWGSLHGYGLFASKSGVPFLGAGYVATVISTTMTVAAAFHQQREICEDVLRRYYDLKERQGGGISEQEDGNGRSA